jgi:tetratricopeptide repeat protein
MADTARIEELRRRVQTDPASIAFAALAEEYRRGGQFDDAIATCRTGLQRHPAYLSARVTLGRSLLEVGRYDEARQELEQVLRAAPENLAAIRALAEIHHRVGELPETEHNFAETEAQPVADPPAAASPAPSVTTAGGAPERVAVAAHPTPLAIAAPAVPAVSPAAAPIPAPTVAPIPSPPTVPIPSPPAATISPPVALPVAPQRATLVAPPSETPVVPPPAPPDVAPSAAAVAPRVAVLLTPQPVSPPPAAPVARPPVPSPRPPHPDEVALPALEAFLSAIVAVRASGNSVAR